MRKKLNSSDLQFCHIKPGREHAGFAENPSASFFICSFRPDEEIVVCSKNTKLFPFRPHDWGARPPVRSLKRTVICAYQRNTRLRQLSLRPSVRPSIFKRVSRHVSSEQKGQKPAQWKLTQRKQWQADVCTLLIQSGISKRTVRKKETWVVLPLFPRRFAFIWFHSRIVFLVSSFLTLTQQISTNFSDKTQFLRSGRWI